MTGASIMSAGIDSFVGAAGGSGECVGVTGGRGGCPGKEDRNGARVEAADRSRGCVEAAGGPGRGVLAVLVTGGSAGASHARTRPVTRENVTPTVTDRRQARLGPRRRR
jgi:hypothetical protein